MTGGSLEGWVWSRGWDPAFAGARDEGGSREGMGMMGEGERGDWIPAFAGMTKEGDGVREKMDSRLRGNDGGVVGKDGCGR